MPGWLQTVSVFNPLSYVVDAMRSMLLTGDYSGLPLDIFVLSLSTAIFISCASILLKRLIE
jgi:ABC-2 type transport system permease protein